MTQEISADVRALRDKLISDGVFGPATPQDKQFDRAWDSILKSDELKSARAKLSIHELRLVIRAAITGKV
jgi:hypothetical protein